MSWHVYILECGDGSFYTGIANDLERRVDEHNAGTGAKCTRARLPVKLIYSERKRNRSYASKREAQIKNLTREEKESLVKTKK